MATRWVCLSDKEIDLATDALKRVGFVGPQVALMDKLRKQQRRIKPASGKDKGRALQHWVCEHLAKLLQIPYDQQDDQCLIHSREMGQSGTDVILRGKAAELFPYAIECKSTENFSMTATIKQAQNNADEHHPWLIVLRSKVIRDPVIVMEFSQLESIYGRLLRKE